jgi:Leucine-rich repeat (LRR) protein
MRKTLLMIVPLLVGVLLFSNCEEPTEPDTTTPTVTITSPQSGSTVSVIVSITCMSSDNEGVEKVELWVNGVPIGLTDNTEPYSFEWNTITYDDGSYTIIVRSYDTSGNTTDSNPITLIVYKTVELWGEYYSIENTTELDLSYSGLTDSIPSEIGYLTNLTYLDLRVNQLTGIPSEIGALTNLEYLSLSQNDITGSIPSEIGNLTNLTTLKLSSNQLTGIPSEIGALTNLEYLSLSQNDITGSIPSEIGNLTNLTELNLGENQLTGEIPSEIGNLTNLTSLSLFNNQLTGEIPSEIGNLMNLIALVLRDNQLTGEIPESICDIYPNLNTFYINNNQLCPPYPSCIPQWMIDSQDTSNCP